MPYTCPTVKVVSPSSPGGFKIINESDLTPDHELWAEDDARRDTNKAEIPQLGGSGSAPGQKKSRAG